MTDPDRATRFLEPGQNFQVPLMQIDKNLIFFGRISDPEPSQQFV